MPSRINANDVPPIAHLQAGLFSRRQAVAAGFSAKQVERRLASGAWVRHRGRGISVAGTPISIWTLAHDAWLTRPGAILLGPLASALHGTPLALPDVVDVWTTAEGDRTRLGLRPRLVPLDAHETVEVTTVDGSPGRIATPRRAATDSLAWLPRSDAHDAVAWFITRGHLNKEDLDDRLLRQLRARGNGQVRQISEMIATGALSMLELDAHAMLAEARLSGWRANIPVYDERGMIRPADILFDAERLNIEIDGKRAHAHRAEEDAEKDRRMRAQGYDVLRLTSKDLGDARWETKQRIKVLLAERRAFLRLDG